MNEGLPFKQSNEAAKFLGRMPSSTRRKGEQYFFERRVKSIVCTEPGAGYFAVVEGSEPYEVDLYYSEKAGWDAFCECPLEISCKHIYAALRYLLAHPQSVPYAPLEEPADPVPPAAAYREPANPLADLLVKKLGRSLRADEKRFLSKLREGFEKCKIRSAITGYDLEQMGLKIGGNSWQELSLWPSFPKHLHEFWQYLALAASERNRAIPEFMLPVTDLDSVRDRVKRWRRSQQVERWKQTLEQSGYGAGTSGTFQTEPFGLRLRLSAKTAVLEWRRPNQSEFVPLRHNQVYPIKMEYDAGALAWTTEAGALWNFLSPRLAMHCRADFGYHDPEVRQMIRQLALSDWLRSLLVNEQGAPFTWVNEPLRWSLAAASGGEDYNIRLTLPDGSSLPPLFLTLAGQPALYFTATHIYQDNFRSQRWLDPGADNLIPAEAIESSAGVQFLRGLGLPLPERLAKRLREVPVHVEIHCALSPMHPGSPSEVCTVEIRARSTDGSVNERFVTGAWLPEQTSNQNKQASKRGELVVYDRSLLGRVADWIQPLNLKVDSYSGHYYLKVTRKFPEMFVSWLQSLPKEVRVHLDKELATLARDPVAGKVRLDAVESEVDWFDLQVALEATDLELTPEELKLLLDAKGGFVRLKEKGWRRLEFELSEQEDQELARLGINPHDLSSEPQRFHALQLADKAAKRFLKEEQFAQVQRRARQIKARVTPAIPAEIQAQLRPYQTDGFHFLAYLSTNRFGGILADDMGLGKTLQTLTWLVWLRAEEGAKTGSSLVVCPKSVMDNWRAEAERFASGLRVKVWPAAELPLLRDRLAEADLHILNYSQLRSASDGLASIEWLAVILDEGQYIKNPASQTAQIARQLRARHRLVLTGTPIENRLLDLWSLMAFAMPGVLGNRNQFGRLYDSKVDPFARLRLASRVRPFLLRRTKKQVAKDLPERIEEDLFCEIEGLQLSLYRAELKRAQQLLLGIKTQKQLNQDRFHFLTSLLRLRQICCHPALVQEKCKAPSAKVEALLDQIEPLVEEGHKVLVFSQFVTMLDLLESEMSAKGWKYFYLAGDTENRAPLVQEFQNHDGSAVFLLSLKAGGFGLNLTAASYVVLFDPWWNPAVENQAIDRTHRIGQTENVIAYRLLIKNSIEEKIRQLQRKKSALAQDILGEEKFTAALTLDDLRFLFSD